MRLTIVCFFLGMFLVGCGSDNSDRSAAQTIDEPRSEEPSDSDDTSMDAITSDLLLTTAIVNNEAAYIPAQC